MPELPQGTVTFLSTDLEGSLRLWERYLEAMQQALVLNQLLEGACTVDLGRHRLRDLERPETSMATSGRRRFRRTRKGCG